jgi:carbohydrate-selective porin OprB
MQQISSPFPTRPVPSCTRRSFATPLAQQTLNSAQWFTRAAAGLVLALVATPLLARAADEPSAEVAEPAPKQTAVEQFKEVWNRDLFTGDWEGWRTTLHDHGIDVGLRLSQYGQGVASGGVDKNGEYGGTMDYRVNTDLRKLFGLWEGVGQHACQDAVRG